MRKLLLPLTLFVLAMLFLSGCLIVEKKEYKLTLTGKNSGKGSIKYINIMSQKEEEKDKSFKDFGELVTDYIEGDKIIQTFPGLKNVKKRLFEENGVLCGEVTFEFDSLETFKIFKYDNDSPFMLVLPDILNNEEYGTSNGEYGKINTKIVFWNKSQKEFTWSTTITGDHSKDISLLEHYNKWKK